MASRPWSYTQLQALRIMVDEGHSNRVIAAALGRSVTAISTMKYRLNIGRNTTRRTAP